MNKVKVKEMIKEVNLYYIDWKANPLNNESFFV